MARLKEVSEQVARHSDERIFLCLGNDVRYLVTASYSEQDRGRLRQLVPGTSDVT